MSGVDWHAPFEELQTGQSFRSLERTVGEVDTIAFAALTDDWHPQHTDRDWAAMSQFGERIAHGMLLVSYAVGLVPLDPARVIALRRLKDVVFKRPVALGEAIHVRGHIASLTALEADAGLVGFRWDVRDSRERVACRAQVDVLWRCGARDRQHAVTDALAPIEFPSGVFPC